MAAWGWLLTGLLLVAAACVTAPAADMPVSAWGPVIRLGETEQADAPALWADPEVVTLAWVDSGEDAIDLRLRSVGLTGLAPDAALPVVSARPYGLTLLPARDSRLHMLWLDADPTSGETRLFAALTQPPAWMLERGPTRLSGEKTFRLSAVANGDGALWVVYSGGRDAEPGLFARYLDGQGRARLQNSYQIAADADWPALVRVDDGRVLVFWLRASDQMVMRGLLTDGGLTDTETLFPSVTLNPGDRLTGFSTGLDSGHVYLLWNITRVDSENETWLAAGGLDGGAWSEPARLGIQPFEHIFETGFNSGTTLGAEAGQQWVSWAAPLAEQHSLLPVAAQVGADVAVIYLRGGAVVGYQAVAPAALIGRPALAADRDRFLYLAWSQPLPTGRAALQLATLRTLVWDGAPRATDG